MLSALHVHDRSTLVRSLGIDVDGSLLAHHIGASLLQPIADCLNGGRAAERLNVSLNQLLGCSGRTTPWPDPRSWRPVPPRGRLAELPWGGASRGGRCCK